MLASQRMTFLEKKENKSSLISIGPASLATVSTPTSMALGIVPPISEAVVTRMEGAVKTNQFNSDQASYAGVAHDIINRILRFKNISNKIQSVHIKMVITQWMTTQANIMLDQVLAKSSVEEVAHLEAGSQFSDNPVFHSKQPK